MSNTRKNRPIALLCLGTFLIQLFSPNISWALTEGPGQPEMTTFQPVGIDNMVDLFSGDFNYNIPLMTVPGPNGGYPINIHYNSTIGMEQEASWVGLGWNINAGAVNRVMKGLPDDFNGTPVLKENNIKTSTNVGVEVDLETELLSIEATDCAPATSAHGTIRIFYDNMIGVGMDLGFNVPSFGKSFPVGLDLNFGTNEGLNFSPSLSHSFFDKQLGFSLGGNINSRSGIQSINFSTHFSKHICRKKNSNDYKAGSGFGISTTSYIPSAQLGFTTINGTFGTKIGSGSLFALKAFYTGEASRTFLKEEYKSKTYKGYGYGYSQNTALHQNDDNNQRLKDELMDFNLEKEGLISKQSPNTANIIPTNDIYAVSSQGFSGTFNHFRNDHGYYYSPMVKSQNYGATLTGDFSVGIASGEVGSEVGLSYSDTYSGPIKGEIFEPGSVLDFNGTSGLKEGRFYKDQDGHNTVQDPASYKKNSDKPNRFKVRQMPSAKVREELLEEINSTTNLAYTGFTDKIREQSNNFLKSYTIAELEDYSIINTIQLWDLNQSAIDASCEEVGAIQAPTDFSHSKTWSNSYGGGNETANAFESYSSDDQVGTFVGVGSDGMTYEYGIPVYNNYQKEAVFSVDYTENGSIQSKTVGYAENNENSNDNGSGDDHFFQSTELPPYAYSHLLTAIYSPDYVDIDNDGPSENDLGYYTKFNYTRAAEDYKWRVPFVGANNMPGHISDDGDNKANYTYGSKEIYYLKSVETSTHIALFILSERADGIEAKNENPEEGEKGDKTLYKLDEIRLYAKSNPCEVIKTVHFDYSYELCEGIPNFNSTYKNEGETGSGKLTLKRIYTTHYGSYKGALSPYEFHYPNAGEDGNPNYNLEHSDHWGTYKVSAYDDGNGNEINGYLGSNNFNPYTNQYSDFDEDGVLLDDDNTARGDQAAAWLIRQITLPSGGEIMIDYEADDYAYVQNERAKQFYKIVGFSKTLNGEVENRLKDVYEPLTNKAHFVHVELDNRFDTEGDAKAYWSRAVANCEDIYFKTYLKLKKPVAELFPVYDYVDGYAKLDIIHFNAEATGVVYEDNNIDGKWYGVVPIIADDVSQPVHPIKLAGFNHLRYERPDLFKNNDLPTAIPALVAQLLGIIPETLSLLTGYINAAKIRGWCNEANLGHSRYPSFLRLHNGDGHKYGGGHRVKEITINDKWSDLSHADENSSTYSLRYHYTLSDSVTSSGVATYEPLIGGEENALKQVKRYKAGIASLDQHLWLEYPINENLYPQASVGYSRVQVESTGAVETQNQFYSDEDQLGIDDRLKSAKIVHEFYTFKDFPIIAQQTGRKLKKQFPPVIPIPCFGSLRFSNSIASQGYSIELNDMHGKQKSVKTFHSTADLTDPDIIPYAKTEYVYRQNNGKLVNENVPFFHPEDRLTNNGVMGRSVEMATYMNENRMIGTSGGNVDSDATFTAGLPIFSLWIKADYTEAHTRLVTTNKIIRRQGIIEKVVTKVGDSETEALNLAYDKQTGAPVVVKKINNFEDPVYISSIPAHWHYDDFKATKLTNGYTTLISDWTNNTINANGLLLTEALFEALPLAVGDKVKVRMDGIRDVLYVHDIDYVNLQINFVDFNGNTGDAIPLFGNFNNDSPLYIEIIETNKNNQLGTQVGQVVSLTNPLLDNTFGSNWLSALNGAIQTAEPFVGSQLDPNSPYYDPRCDTYAPDTSTDTPNMYCGYFECVDACGNNYNGSVKLIKRDGYLEVLINFICAEESNSDCEVSFLDVELKFTDQLNDPDSGPYHDFSNTYLSIDEDANLFEIHDGENQENDEFYSGLDFMQGDVNVDSVRSVFEYDCPIEVLQASAMTLSDQWDYHYDLNNITNYVSLSQIMENPYLYGKRGNYRVKSSYVYQAPRKQQDNDSHLDKDGVFVYDPFRWCQDFEQGCDVDALNPEWTKASTMTKYDAFNHALEETNALGISSAVMFSRDQNHVIASAQNAKHLEIAFEDFEGLDAGAGTYLQGNHFDLIDNGEIVNHESHTGQQSLRLDGAGGTLQITYEPSANTPNLFTPIWTFATWRKYLLSFWVKTEDVSGLTVSVTNNNNNNNNSNGLLLDTEINETPIEGWYKVDALITQNQIISLAEVISINYSSTEEAYIDDIRIHPFEAGIETYVYDYVKQRPVAILDNQNYATFYNYDEQGGLTQVKKETVNGVLTLQTTRSHVRKN